MGRVKRVRTARRPPQRGILLDTHALVWWLAGDDRMPPRLRRRLAGTVTAAHRDPFDRILAAQATLEELDLVSADPVFPSLGVAAVW